MKCFCVLLNYIHSLLYPKLTRVFLAPKMQQLQNGTVLVVTICLFANATLHLMIGKAGNILYHSY